MISGSQSAHLGADLPCAVLQLVAVVRELLQRGPAGEGLAVVVVAHHEVVAAAHGPVAVGEQPHLHGPADEVSVLEASMQPPAGTV